MKTILVTVIVILSFIQTYAQDDHVGLWMGINQGKFAYVNLDSSGYATFVIHEDTIGGASFDVDGELCSMTYETDYGRRNNAIDLIMKPINKNVEGIRMPGIFKFDKEHRIHLCINFDGRIRPSRYNKDYTMILNKVHFETDKASRIDK